MDQLLYIGTEASAMIQPGRILQYCVMYCGANYVRH